MPLTLSQIAANRASVTLAYGGETVTLEYAPGLITETTIAQMSAVAASAETVETLATPDDATPGATADASGTPANANAALRNLASFTTFMGSVNSLLARVILAWDVYEDDAQTQMVALTPERLADLPIEFRVLCFRAIFGGLRLGETSGTRSSARSRATTSTATRGGSRR